MEVKVFEGKLGREHYIFNFMLEHNNCCLPRKKEKICLNGDRSNDGIIKTVKRIITA